MLIACMRIYDIPRDCSFLQQFEITFRWCIVHRLLSRNQEIPAQHSISIEIHMHPVDSQSEFRM